MFRKCELIANKITRTGHNVSHSKVKTNRLFKPNIQNKTYTVFFESLNRKVTFDVKLSATAIRTIDNQYGSFKDFILKYKKAKLTPKALKIRKIIERFDKWSQKKIAVK